jgi:hypothetical protein
MTNSHMHIVLYCLNSTAVRVNVRQRNSFYINLVANNSVSKGMRIVKKVVRSLHVLRCHYSAMGTRYQRELARKT